MNPPLNEITVRESLKTVIDPELGYNIVDLGLVYDITVQGSHIAVMMTMTTPGCPAAGFIESGVHRCLENLLGVQSLEVQVVWNPPWGPEMMSPDAKAFFGFA